MKWKPARQKRPRKFRPGEPFTSIVGLIDWVVNGGWVYWLGPRPKHPSIIRNQQLQVLLGAVGRKTMRPAIRTEPDPSECPF